MKVKAAFFTGEASDVNNSSSRTRRFKTEATLTTVSIKGKNDRVAKTVALYFAKKKIKINKNLILTQLHLKYLLLHTKMCDFF